MKKVHNSSFTCKIFFTIHHSLAKNSISNDLKQCKTDLLLQYQFILQLFIASNTLLYFSKPCSVKMPNLALHSNLVLVQDGLLNEFLVNIQETQFINEVLCLNQLPLLCHLLNKVQVILCFCNLWFLLPFLWFLRLKISGGDRGNSNAFIF